ncbi:transmembrane anchor protein [Azospirillum palustre]|uniref:Transmembrane anchor protein n=1 Tax=Azospirillum palustre TaxID=2044885 RepID=A0A2B8BGG0_9PROT|nr:transmembrane anchor protein [Azospirillum palustre]PGH56850.1 transmembrane anchor protein [Azospirillum palustre]
MFNANIPPVSELPSSAQLLRSTAIAAATASVLLVTAVLPAEYGIDPTGVGRVLGLTQMGEIKVQLQEEAEADRPGAQGAAAPAGQQSFDLKAVGDLLAGLVVSPAAAQTLPVQIAQTAQSDTVKLTLNPGEGAEVKAVMTKDATLTYSWKSEGGPVNHDTHGEPTANPNATHSYKKGRGVAGDDGVLKAAFDGHHGWFWRNRGDAPVTIILIANGAYSDFKRVK